MPRDDDIFVKDDLNNSAENRLNHVLFGLFLKDKFREAVLRRLEITQPAIIYKPTNVWGQERPDFAIESYDGEKLGYIEVELDKDNEQLTRYQDHARKEGLEVYTFWREEREEKDRNITLQKLVEIAKDALNEDRNPQFELMVRHLEKQVRESEGVRKNPPPGPVQSQLETLLGERLLGAGMVNWGEEPVQPGKLYGWAKGPHGISVRVFSRQSKDYKTVGLFNILGGQEMVRFASYRHLARYLPDRLTELDKWADFIEQRLKGDIKRIGDNFLYPVSISVVEANVDGMIEALLPLR